MATLYTIRSSPGEGLGSFAKENIAAGTLILREAPLFNVHEPRNNASVTSKFSLLTPTQRQTYLSLHAQDPSACGDALVIDIFNSNAWQTGSRTSICPLAARFNHSCVPNAKFAWNPRSSQITVHAVVAIPADTQIFLSYERPYQMKEGRQEKLSSAYGFTCACSACDATNVASDVRRARLATLDSRIRSEKRQLWKAHWPRHALEMISLLKKEGILGEALGLAYHDAALGWKRYGRLDLARNCAAMELEVVINCFGPDSPCVDATQLFLQELKQDGLATLE
ncbi:hypothetical protein IAQ61_008861 [Plenodomus lingam]|uniref:Similar to SET domain-containing protein 5 n=1 Tax=Leptosphaeria maculans (strain JN3 / isolate v23.1.3 / race Av1-4-5-6-7-8) TaxID=985895 RepID=E4ZPA9_LEPMJ|nr:similar to SET domain-containing protein 5 [Plenodomus lingam JN3]KAH9864916.1 hypothetical protein IAQ61_008861 [Plenodomus lingam]CBX93134.1 similar to SET domain-containing protein 5 [Plenodomus lingam JN3]